MDALELEAIAWELLSFVLAVFVAPAALAVAWRATLAALRIRPFPLRPTRPPLELVPSNRRQNWRRPPFNNRPRPHRAGLGGFLNKAAVGSLHVIRSIRSDLKMHA